MNSRHARFEETLTIIQNIIADLTGNEIEYIDPESGFEDDLGITETDFRIILRTINSYFNIDLKSREIADEIETVAELSRLVQEESELG